MPPQQARKTGLLNKLGSALKTEAAKHVGEDIKYGIINLPPGIKNGVAKLVECYFDLYKTGDNTGQPYCRMAGVVVEPEFVDTPQGPMKVQGLQTSVMIPCCDTKNSKGEVTTALQHMTSANTNVLNEFRKLGVEFSDAPDGPEFEAAAAALVGPNKEDGPYFKFSTSETKGQKAPDGKVYAARTWENWHGVKDLVDYMPPEAAPMSVGSGGDGGGNSSTATSATGDEDGDGIDLEQDLTTLLAKAEAKDAVAQQRLMDLCAAAGFEEQAAAAASWEEVVALLRGDAPAEEPSTPPEPVKGGVCQYAPPNPVKKGTFLKAVKCEIQSVDKKTSIVTLKNLIDGKTIYKGVAFDKITLS